jgi:hypothetical protein
MLSDFHELSRAKALKDRKDSPHGSELFGLLDLLVGLDREEHEIGEGVMDNGAVVNKDRVLIHIDTEKAEEKLVNRRLAYVAISRGRYDAQIYTNDKTSLAEGLGRDVSHRSAMEPQHAQQPPAHQIERSSASSQAHEHTQAEGHSISR